MRILAVDTSSKNCSVAIVEVDKNKNFNVLVEKNNGDEKTHSQKLMPIIDEALREQSLSLDDINLLACCLGPGSFTGIRIGIATVKAFADAKNIPTVGVTSLESLAYNVVQNSIIFPIIDCKNDNVYSALFLFNDNTYSQIGNNIAENINTVLNDFSDLCEDAEISTITFVGDGSILYHGLIEKKFADYKIIFSDNNTQSSVSLAKCAYEKYLNGLYGDSNYISPLYLRKSQAERAKDGEKWFC